MMCHFADSLNKHYTQVVNILTLIIKNLIMYTAGLNSRMLIPYQQTLPQILYQGEELGLELGINLELNLGWVQGPRKKICLPLVER